MFQPRQEIRRPEDDDVQHGDLSRVINIYICIYIYVHISTNHLQSHTGRHCSMMQHVAWQDRFLLFSLCFHERHSNENNRFLQVSGCQAAKKQLLSVCFHERRCNENSRILEVSGCEIAKKTAVVACSRRVVLVAYRQSAKAPPDQQNLPWRVDPGKRSSQQERQRPDDEDVQHVDLSSLTYITYIYTHIYKSPTIALWAALQHVAWQHMAIAATWNWSMLLQTSFEYSYLWMVTDAY